MKRFNPQGHKGQKDCYKANSLELGFVGFLEVKQWSPNMLRGLIKCLEGQSGQPFEKRQLQNQKKVPWVKKFHLTKN